MMLTEEVQPTAHMGAMAVFGRMSINWTPPVKPDKKEMVQVQRTRISLLLSLRAVPQ